MQVSTDSLLGRWITDPCDEPSIKEFGNVQIEFTPDGKMIYTIHANAKDQIILLTYRLEEGVLITDQPSHPQEEKTPCQIGSDGKLRLTTDGHTATYIRA